jgi:hypothetical protein
VGEEISCPLSLVNPVAPTSHEFGAPLLDQEALYRLLRGQGQPAQRVAIEVAHRGVSDKKTLRKFL